MQNIVVIMWSMVYILVVLGIATLVSNIGKGSSELSRKLVHILLGNWVFFTPYFTELWAVVLVPLVFIVINSLSLKYNLISAMERDDDSLGTVYYAISLFILSGAGFLLNWELLPFIGILTMAYGDGLAAVVGQKWGKKKPFSFAPEKTIAGSMMVAITSFIVTVGFIHIFGRMGKVEVVSIPMLIFIGILTSIVSVFIELTGKKGSDNLTLPIGSGLFATLTVQFASTGLFIYLTIATIILIVAYKLHSITADGIVAAFLTALTLYTLGGPWVATSLLVFFILGSLVSKFKNKNKIQAESLQGDSGARNWKQVLANSLPASILVWIAYIFPDNQYLLLPAFAVFSAAAADTFSSEIGMMTKGKVFNILTGKPMAGGLSGGVSVAGLFAGLIGSILLSLLAVPQFGWVGMFIVSILGFLGTIFDSIIGILLQSKYIGKEGQLQDVPNNPYDNPVKGWKIITNNAVNFITLSLVSLSGNLFCLFIK